MSDVNLASMPHPVILYVEDELLIQSMVLDAFEHSGFMLLTAISAIQAMAMLADPAIQIEGLITDINLNSALSGWDVARAGRVCNSALPVIYVSGASSHEWIAQGVSGSDMITKPFAPSFVVEAMNAQFDKMLHVIL
jgi:DNA-binding response OmpR family regulator